MIPFIHDDRPQSRNRISSKIESMKSCRSMYAVNTKSLKRLNGMHTIIFCSSKYKHPPKTFFFPNSLLCISRPPTKPCFSVSSLHCQKFLTHSKDLRGDIQQPYTKNFRNPCTTYGPRPPQKLFQRNHMLIQLLSVLGNMGTALCSTVVP